MPAADTKRREKRPANHFSEEGNGLFAVTFKGRARRAYLWVILILAPLPLSAVAALIFRVLPAIAWMLGVLFLLQVALAVFAVLTMSPVISYVFDPATGIVTYRRVVFRRVSRRAFANARNFRHLFVSSQVVGRSRRYLVFQLKAIHVDGTLVNLSGYEAGHPGTLNAVGAEVARRLELPFTPAAADRVSKVIKKLGPKIVWRVEQVMPA